MQQLKYGLIILLGITITACQGLISEQGNGERIEKTFTVDPFTEIELSGGYDVTLTPSESHDITLQIDENLLRFIEIEVRGEKLIIRSDRSLNSPQGIKIEIPVKDLKELFSSGASNVGSKKPILAKDLSINLSGAGKIDLALDVNKIELNLSGAALIYLEGVAKEFKISMSGAGTVEAEAFEVEDCIVEISGIGSAMVNVTGSLEAQVSGLGKVEYTGNPQSVKGDVSGVGEIDESNN